MDLISLLMLLGFALATFAAGATGVLFRPGEWYKRLDKPAWRPPDRLFAPVWTLLYATIALSGWLVWREGGLSDAALPLTVYTLCSMSYVVQCTAGPAHEGLSGVCEANAAVAAHK